MRRIFYFAREFFAAALRLIFSLIFGGYDCVICRKPNLFIPLCDSCRKKHFSPESLLLPGRCSFCGKILTSEESLCLECREKRIIVSADRVISFFSYRLWNKELLFLWKIGGIRSLSLFFARFFAFFLRELGIECVVPVPPRPDKIKKNGWDQIDELSQILKYRFGFRLLPILERTSDFEQKKLNREQRLSKSSGSYVMKEQNEIRRLLRDFGNAFPERVCIIDDVCTTGSTIESCARLLRMNTSIKSVYAMTLFGVD